MSLQSKIEAFLFKEKRSELELTNRLIGLNESKLNGLRQNHGSNEKKWRTKMKQRFLFAMTLVVIGSLLLTACGAATSSQELQKAYVLWDVETDAAAQAFANSGLYPHMTREELLLYYFTYNVKYEVKTASEAGLVGYFAIPITRAVELSLPSADLLSKAIPVSPILMVFGGTLVVGGYMTTDVYQETLKEMEDAHQLVSEDKIVVSSVWEPEVVQLSSPTFDGWNMLSDEQKWKEVEKLAVSATNNVLEASVHRTFKGPRGTEVVITIISTEKTCWMDMFMSFTWHDGIDQQSKNFMWNLDDKNRRPGPCTGLDWFRGFFSLADQLVRFSAEIKVTIELYDKWFYPVVQDLIDAAMTALERGLYALFHMN